ncbi:MAG: NADH-quinone oxidoreductase subunit NuoE [Terriglobales bacterium]
MLSSEEQSEIQTEASHYPYKRAVAIDALKIVQKHRGHVSDEAMDDVARFLDLSREELDGVCTFYNLLLRKPVGHHVIWVCDGVSCWLTGYGRLRRQLETTLGVKPGETTADGKFTLLPIVCLGACDHAPVLMVDDDLHHDLDPQRNPNALQAVLQRYD